MTHKVNAEDYVGVPEVSIVCDKHRNRRLVARYWRTSTGWDAQLDLRGGLVGLLTGPSGRVSLRGDHVMTTDPLKAGSVLRLVQDGLAPGEPRTVYENHCPRCPANYPMREDRLVAVLDAITGAGRTVATLRELEAVDRRLRAE